jgi:biopolymer transport protein ExbD
LLFPAIGDDAVARDHLGPALDTLTSGDKEQRVFLRADKAVPYGELMGVMNALRAAGYLKVGLVGLESDRQR